MGTARSYLFVTFEGGGNVPPVLGIVRRLAARGHRVRVLTEPCLQAAVEEAGADFVAFTRHFTRQDRTEDIFGDWQARTPLGALNLTLERVMFGPAPVVAEETRRVLHHEHTDVVVADILMPGALVAAEAAGIPRTVLFHMPEYLPGPGRPAAGPGFLPRNDLVGRLRDKVLTYFFLRQLKAWLPAYNEARRTAGLRQLTGPDDLVEEFHRADLRLVQTSRAFDFPITPPPANVRYVGPVLDDPDWVGSWNNPWETTDTRPLVVVGLSSTFQNQRAVLQRIIEALGKLAVRGLVTLGPPMAGEKFNLPPNVVAVESASHAQVFPHAAAVVTHAGHGTVMRALSHGLPLLCLPMGRDQDDNAARVFAAGAGLRLKPSAASDRIAASLRRLLDEPVFRKKADEMRRHIESDVRAERAVRELEQVGLRSVDLGG